MEATIKYINIYEDGLIEMIVMCNNCKCVNYHTITHSSIKKDNKINIDFSKLGSRCCNNQGKITDKNSFCYANYKLYI